MIVKVARGVLFAFMMMFVCNNVLQAQVEVVADGRLQTILEKHVEYNQMAKTFIGFRIKVATFTGDNAKNKAFELKKQLLETFVGQRVYVVFDEPNFNVKMGDYATRLDAYSFYMQIKPQIKTAIIIKDYINSPLISEEDISQPEYFEDELEDAD